MRKDGHPLPEVAWDKRVSLHVLPPLQASFSGELVAIAHATLGAPRFAGAIKEVWISVAQSGKDDTNELNVSGDVLINSVSCLTTKASIAHVSGEASQQKTTKAGSSDSGIQAAVLDYTNYTFEPGDVFEVKWYITRTASPTTEIQNPVVVVELEPT